MKKKEVFHLFKETRLLRFSFTLLLYCVSNLRWFVKCIHTHNSRFPQVVQLQDDGLENCFCTYSDLHSVLLFITGTVNSHMHTHNISTVLQCRHQPIPCCTYIKKQTKCSTAVNCNTTGSERSWNRQKSSMCFFPMVLGANDELLNSFLQLCSAELKQWRVQTNQMRTIMHMPASTVAVWNKENA